MAGVIKHMQRSHAGMDKNYSAYRGKISAKPMRTKYQKVARTTVEQKVNKPAIVRKIGFFRRIFRKFKSLFTRQDR